MFRRISTYYLILIGINSGLLLLLPVAQFKHGEQIYDFYLRGITVPTLEGLQSFRFPFLTILSLLITLVPVISLFFVKDMKLKLSIGRIMYILIIGLLCALLFYINWITGMLESSTENSEALTGYRGFYFPVIALVFVFLSNRALKQEEAIEELFKTRKKK